MNIEFFLDASGIVGGSNIYIKHGLPLHVPLHCTHLDPETPAAVDVGGAAEDDADDVSNSAAAFFLSM